MSSIPNNCYGTFKISLYTTFRSLKKGILLNFPLSFLQYAMHLEISGHSPDNFKKKARSPNNAPLSYCLALYG